MKMKSILVCLFALALSLGFSQASMAEEGVTDTEIHVGQWGPLTGPGAPWGAILRGMDTYFQMINDEGGIHGRKIKYHMFDDGYNPAKTVAGVKQLQEGTGIFAWVGGVGTAPGLAVKDYLMERKIPWISPSAGSMQWVRPPQKYIFATYPLYYTEAKSLVRYAVQTMKKKRVAITYLNDEYGKNGLRGAIEEMKANGMKLVAEIPVNANDKDMKPHVRQLRRAKADVVLLWVTPTHAVRLVGTSKAMKYAPQFMSTSTLSDFPLMHAITKGLWKDTIVANFIELPDSKSPLMKKYKAAFDQFASKKERWGIFFYAGMGFAEPFVEGLKRVGPNLTRERLVAELEKLKNFKGIMGNISFKKFNPNDPTTRMGQQEVFLTKALDKGQSEKLTDWMKVE